eukprot:CAMPEP_0195521260 /NCGR_PEP_ID=MMETSP0794_2-20130614/18327_1 /TAXON_ID=515487 /ORGANISM="Stephanopyxis turris, Strain CCMP 815" /LENGTH=63 /DNA_ID=CAMNT_0040650779 /DNA_START=64 /DNA_END=252 /DNA_ORIENTATION=+
MQAAISSATQELRGILDWLKRNWRPVVITITVLLFWRFVVLENVFPKALQPPGGGGGGGGGGK